MGRESTPVLRELGNRRQGHTLADKDRVDGKTGLPQHPQANDTKAKGTVRSCGGLQPTHRQHCCFIEKSDKGDSVSGGHVIPASRDCVQFNRHQL